MADSAVVDPLARPREAFGELLEDGAEQFLRQLCEQSVDRRWEAYHGLDWTSDGLRLERGDPRCELPEWDPLRDTDWYRDQSPSDRSDIGLGRFAYSLIVATGFETTIQRGLLLVAAQLPPDSLVWRYMYHEVVEEANHSLMFREFVVRTGLDLLRPPVSDDSHVTRLAVDMPELFFLAAAAVEYMGDWYQRGFVASGDAQDPLIVRICDIHASEEARHLSFARQFLRTSVPRLDAAQRGLLEELAPVAATKYAKRMLTPPPEFAETFGIPADVVGSAYGGTEQDTHTRQAARRIVSLVEQLELVTAGNVDAWGELRSGPSS